jgi:hypothetical protein
MMINYTLIALKLSHKTNRFDSGASGSYTETNQARTHKPDKLAVTFSRAKSQGHNEEAPGPMPPTIGSIKQSNTHTHILNSHTTQ